jgi:hypothetical protein
VAHWSDAQDDDGADVHRDDESGANRATAWTPKQRLSLIHTVTPYMRADAVIVTVSAISGQSRATVGVVDHEHSGARYPEPMIIASAVGAPRRPRRRRTAATARPMASRGIAEGGAGRVDRADQRVGDDSELGGRDTYLLGVHARAAQPASHGAGRQWQVSGDRPVPAPAGLGQQSSEDGLGRIRAMGHEHRRQHNVRDAASDSPWPSDAATVPESIDDEMREPFSIAHHG